MQGRTTEAQQLFRQAIEVSQESKQQRPDAGSEAAPSAEQGTADAIDEEGSWETGKPLVKPHCSYQDSTGFCTKVARQVQVPKGSHEQASTAARCLGIRIEQQAVHQHLVSVKEVSYNTHQSLQVSLPSAACGVALCRHMQGSQQPVHNLHEPWLCAGSASWLSDLTQRIDLASLLSEKTTCILKRHGLEADLHMKGLPHTSRRERSEVHMPQLHPAHVAFFAGPSQR